MKTNDYDRVAAAIGYLERHAAERPSLDAVAGHLALSPSHFQRLFRRWAGVSPKQFLQALALARAQERLRDSASVLDAAFAAGLSGPGRLHDLFVAVEAVTPGEYKGRGRGVAIRYGFHDTPFGEALLACTGRGLCHLGFVGEGGRGEALETLAAEWPEADRREDAAATEVDATTVFAPAQERPGAPLRLHLRGTNFQLQVWRALLRIPEGAAVSYGDLARRLGRPAAHRAVASAVGANPVAYLIPCHRVLRASGALGGYRWGLPRKHAMLARELAAAP